MGVKTLSRIHVWGETTKQRRDHQAKINPSCIFYCFFISQGPNFVANLVSFKPVMTLNLSPTRTSPALAAALFVAALGVMTSMPVWAQESPQEAPKETQGAEAPTPQAGSFPKWSQFPVAPTDVPKPSEIAARVRTQQQVQANLNRGVAALVWDGEDPDTLAELIRSKVDPVMGKPLDSAIAVEEIESLAQDLRRKATPPPPIDRF